ncbi:MAG: hypothetical protein ACOX19_00995 [Fermentimonas sp.]|jgi:hypothetical protein
MMKTHPLVVVVLFIKKSMIMAETMNVTPDELMNSVLGKVYDVLTSGDGVAPKSEDNFFSWATPGIPVKPEDFDFLSQGLTGVVKRADLEALSLESEKAEKSEGDETEGQEEEKKSSLEITPELLEKLRAQDTSRLYLQAENLARLVDFIPDVGDVTDEKTQATLRVMQNEGSLSDVYDYTLKMSQVMAAELDEKTKEKIEKFRKLLTVEKVEKNIITDEETTVVVDSPLVTLYNEKMAAYMDAALEYNSRRIDALDAADSRSVHYWAMNANILRNKVKAAMADWINNGYKKEYEQIAAFISQVMSRDMSMLKQEYIDTLEKARLTGLASGSDFFYSSLIPGNFAQSSGWTEFKFTMSDYKRYQDSSYHSRSSKLTTKSGSIFHRHKTVNTQTETDYSINNSFDASNFYLTFEMCQVPISRPWFKQAFLNSKYWRFDQNNVITEGQLLSDGNMPPKKGILPAYPTSVIFIRNLYLHYGKSSGMSNYISEYEQKTAEYGGSVNIGFFNIGLGGGYGSSSTKSSSESSQEYSYDSQGIRVPGMQIIGYNCHILGKSPDPNPDIKDWI